MKQKHATISRVELYERIWNNTMKATYISFVRLKLAKELDEIAKNEQSNTSNDIRRLAQILDPFKTNPDDTLLTEADIEQLTLKLLSLGLSDQDNKKENNSYI